jgi:hypothetical protein
MNYNSLIISSYGQFVEDKLNLGWTAYILTLTFRHVSGSFSSVHRRMENELERIYATMLTRLIRYPMSKTVTEKLPIWFGCPDFPVPKHHKQSLSAVTINDGLHYHAICLIPPVSRLKEPLSEHVIAHQGLYARYGTLVSHFQADLIISSPGYVVGYVLKSLAKGRANPDQIIVFPRSRSELEDRTTSRRTPA